MGEFRNDAKIRSEAEEKNEFYEDLMTGFNEVLADLRGEIHLKRDIVTVKAEFDSDEL